MFLIRMNLADKFHTTTPNNNNNKKDINFMDLQINTGASSFH